MKKVISRNFETCDNDEIKCPYCNYEIIDSWAVNDGCEADAAKYDCDSCGKTFYWSRSYTVIINSAKDCELNDEQHLLFKHPHHKDDGWYKCSKCDATLYDMSVTKKTDD